MKKNIFESGNLWSGLKVWGIYLIVILKTKFFNINKYNDYCSYPSVLWEMTVSLFTVALCMFEPECDHAF